MLCWLDNLSMLSLSNLYHNDELNNQAWMRDWLFNLEFQFQSVFNLESHCPIARNHTIKDIEENNWSHDQIVRCRAARHHTAAVLETTKWTICATPIGGVILQKLPLCGEKIFSRQPCYWSHDFNFLHKPIVYGVAHLLYGVALSASVSLVSLAFAFY